MAKSNFHADSFEMIEAPEAEIIEALGMIRGGKTYESLKSTTRATKEQVYTIEDETGYDHVSWMETSCYVKQRDVFQFRLDNKLLKYVIHLKKHFSTIPLSAIGRLQGKYAIRLFELILTQAGQEGKKGNPPGTWWYEDTVESIRHCFDAKKKYRATGEFRRNVIDLPIREINDANIGLHITVKYLHARRRLVAVRFQVQRVKTAEPRVVSPITESDNEDERLKREYPDLYRRLYDEERTQVDLPFGSADLLDRSAEGAALKRLRDQVSAKKGRPRKIP